MGSPALSRTCADDVLDVLPDAMDAIRLGMRSQLSNRLSVPQFRCLNFIDHTSGCSVGEVAAFLGVLPHLADNFSRIFRLRELSTPA